MNRSEQDERERLFAAQVRALVWSGAVEAFGAVRHEDPIEGYQVLTRSRLDNPLAGVTAALVARNAAARQLAEFAESARAAGRSWDEIGAALGLDSAGDGGGRSRAELAFEWLVEGREPQPEPDRWPSFRAPTTSWRCATCGQRVTDRGPYESHPDDNEDGHAEACARHRADVRAWVRRTGWEDDQ
ncbi:hypothetical protein H7X46_02705 [Pseudonocardia sp. C8]|uniref:hypothetical protein n=1 Tax=Pseudonocardia sp. C8 TaxID=2762759 RepID=UPI001642E92E|nr:hypothetical protein [Pseudonocardia sp. C8]MBC3189972.1 hypothetical protein [Pseudonocardia sp. C8]